jgi:hypothetical protein
MTFRVSEYLPHKNNSYDRAGFNEKYIDTGKEFTISIEEARAVAKEFGGYGLIDEYTIATIMLKKVYGFSQRVWGWTVNWSQKFVEGNINGIWHIKRVL